MVTTRLYLFTALLASVALARQIAAAAQHVSKRDPNYYGTYVGSFKNKDDKNDDEDERHIGTVYAIDESTFFIKNFTYDGQRASDSGWPTYFSIGNSKVPGPGAIEVPYPDSRSLKPLGAYHNADIILRLPNNIKIRDIKWLSLWCKRFAMSFGTVYIPNNLHIPQPRVLPEFSRLHHGLRSDNITILDSKTFYIPNLHYDGGAPAAYFWVGKGTQGPDDFGFRIPNEVNGTQPLKAYEGVDIEIVLPGNLTVYDIDYLGMWCVEYHQNFGHVLIPKDLDVPPALGQTKIAPAWWYAPTSSTAPPDMSNCIELLDGRVQVQWELQGEDVQIRVSARIREDQYVAFGLSGTEGKAQMVGSDIVLVFYNKNTQQFMAEDYYMSAYAQCDGRTGVCPDHRVGGKNDVVLITGKRSNGITSVTYKRPLRTNELEYDKIIPIGETSIVVAIGLLNKDNEANAHLPSDANVDDIRINFNGQGVYQCNNSLYNLPNVPEIKPWPAMSIPAGEDTFNLRIGPTGGERGYSRITGQPSWGIAWYVNGLLIPELTVERGQNYTFIVEGGKDKTNIADYHPLYITDSPEGGFGQLMQEQQHRQRVFAGIDYDQNNYPYPTAVGRLCKYKPKGADQFAKSETFKQYFETLRLECEDGEPGKLVWHVEENTPDVVYYQCYTHKNLGWKINVVDQGYSAKAESNGNSIAPSISLIFVLIFARLR